MQHFKDKEQAIGYIIPELVDTLYADIHDQKRNNEPPEDYQELFSKIVDIKEVQPLMEAAQDLLDACKSAYNKLLELEQDAGHNLFIAEEADIIEKAISKAQGS